MSKTLRHEYNTKKVQKNKLISNTAYRWLEENVILVNEKIDRRTVSRLIKSIQKFEDTFGPYKDKLPTISQHLDAAEQGLQLVITGKSSDRKTSNLLKQLSFLYSTFGDFFSRDLPVLLKTPLLKRAKEVPDTPLKDLADNSITKSRVVEQEGEGDVEPAPNVKINIKAVEDTFANAIKPSGQEMALLTKLYSSTPLPQLNVRTIARQMLDLSYNDLEDLTNVGKVPKVVTPEEEDLSAEKEEDESAGGLGDLNTPASEAPSVPESVQYGNLEKTLLTEGGQMLLKEIAMLLEASVEEIEPRIKAIKSGIAQIPALKDLSNAVSTLESQIIQVLADGDVKTYLAQIQNKKGSLKDLFQTPKGKILSQANIFIETIKNIAKAWPEVSPFLDKEQVSAADITNVKKIMTKAVSGGMLGKIASVFKTKPFPGLSPEEILSALSKPLDEYLKLATAPNAFSAESKNTNKTVITEAEDDTGVDAAVSRGTTGDDGAMDALNAFKTSMGQIQNLVKGGGETVSATGSAPAQPSAAAKEAEQTKQTAAPDTPGKKQTAGSTNPAGTSGDADTLSNLTAALKGVKPADLQKIANVLANKGFKVIPK